MLRRWFLTALCLAATCGPAAADYDKGYLALGRGDMAAAVQELTASAEANDGQAQYLLGIIYTNGMAGAADPQRGLVWLRRAAESDNIDAQVELAQLYQNGQGTAKDMREALRWYRRAAELGHVGAQLAVADLYLFGGAGAADHAQAYLWYAVASDYWGELVEAAKTMAASHLTAEQMKGADEAAQQVLARLRN
jgi:TPR repeat protein